MQPYTELQDTHDENQQQPPQTKTNKQKVFLNLKGSGEIAQWSRVPTTPEAQSSIHSTHVGWLTTAWNSNSWEPVILLGAPQAPALPCTYSLRHSDTHITKNRTLFLLSKGKAMLAIHITL